MSRDTRSEHSQSPAERDGQIIIGPDGTVLAAVGQSFPNLVHNRLEDCPGLPPAVLDAATDLLERLHRSTTRGAIQTVLPDIGSGAVQLIAIDALPVRREKTDIRALLTSKLAVLSYQASSVDVALNVVIADEVPAVVHLDAEKLAWAVTTLVGNALRYVQAGARRTSDRSISVRASVDAARSRLTIEVQDNGLGVPADTVARLFKRDGLDVRGGGLALLLMSDICAAHGGSIDLQSSTDAGNHGTTVRLTFRI